jgi:hypothetical protein
MLGDYSSVSEVLFDILEGTPELFWFPNVVDHILAAEVKAQAIFCKNSREILQTVIQGC